MYKTLTPRRSRKTFRTVEPGYFTELVRKFNWPPDWQPMRDWGKDSIKHRDIARANREQRQAQGHTGSISGLTPKADELIVDFQANRARIKRC
jgi:hypothetical protein